MKVLMISTSYPEDERDWRGVFIRHLAGGVARRPDLLLSLWAPPGKLPPRVESVTTATEAAWLGSLMKAGGISHLMREKGWRGFDAPLRLLRMLWNTYRRETSADLYHVNWLQCALPLPADGKPVVVSVLGNDLNLLRIPGMRHLLRRTFLNRPVALCPNAEWMVPVLERAFGDLAEVIPVSFGIDSTWYDVQRTIVEPAEWIAVTRLTANKLGPLFEWSEPLFRHGGRTLHLLGPMQEQIAIPDWVRWHGPATPEELATHWFPRAQGLITLSTHSEGRPQTMLEAKAASLPIIASDMPAHATMIENGVDGFLCSDPTGYANAIAALEDGRTNISVGEQARKDALAKFGTWDDAGARYATIYHRLMTRAGRGH
ncbi:group 1 glycosyl transferase [Luteibacter rhizovicinus DSM 16549]|uniref:Group 1 glycosyl transferase n=1 Tax=Luteibacter rhizovicinus DSM 16549 TaxID=1440763 RepID=A0A1L3EUJ0_9GAMM|nr:glycosyltransferase family 4 protein [Luteibacter rhizovicinus]APG04726.1 group 1 glycosyl transferase [Luteibacter rhizovicinus DSM 16549]